MYKTNRQTQHCPDCADTDVRVDHAFHPADEAVYCERCGWEGRVGDLVSIPSSLVRCGLNADWSVDAWFISTAANHGCAPNTSDGSRYLLDNEDGSFSIVRRYYRDDDNDQIDEIATFDSLKAAIAAATTN